MNMFFLFKNIIDNIFLKVSKILTLCCENKVNGDNINYIVKQQIIYPFNSIGPSVFKVANTILLKFPRTLRFQSHL